ncbi:hypothetical protein CPB86DRAFT_785114 [Serendipita vermifera]|nr:hypothetical protein CPB86DRAFT_785114 [Serendipita vermifera]
MAAFLCVFLSGLGASTRTLSKSARLLPGSSQETASITSQLGRLVVSERASRDKHTGTGTSLNTCAHHMLC